MKKTIQIFGVLLIAAMLLGAFAMTASAEKTTIPTTLYVDVTNVTAEYDDYYWRAEFTTSEGSIDYIDGYYPLAQVASETNIYSVEVPEGAVDMHFAFDALGQHYTTRQLVPTDGRNLFVITGESSGSYTGYWHTYDPDNGGVQPFASVTTATGTTTNYKNIDDAINAAVASEGSTLKLLGDVQPTTLIESGTFTLDLNGYNFTAPDGKIYAIYLSSGHLTIKDSVGTGQILKNAKDSDIVAASGGSITIYGGNFGDVYNYSANGTVTIYGGSYAVVYGQRSTYPIQIYSATIQLVSTNDGNIWRFLSPNGFYYDADGNLLDAREVLRAENVTVRQGADLKDAVLTLEYESSAYTGVERKPGVTVTVLGKNVSSEHYQVTYEDNINVGQATATVTAQGDIYTGTNSTTFTIEKATPVVTAPTPYEADYLIWTGLSKLMLKDEGSTTGGTLMYNVNGAAWGSGVNLVMDAGTYTIGYKVVGDDNWNDVEPQYIVVVIEKRDFSDSDHRVSISLSESSFVYDGTEKTPTVTLPFEYWNGTIWDDYTIKTGNYEVSYSANVNAGTVTVTVTGVGNCTGTISTTFEIAPVALTGENFVLDADEFTYNGAEQNPPVAIAVDGLFLTEGTDYTISWPADMTNAGTKTVTVTGNYAGSFTYEIKKADPTVVATSPTSQVLSGNKVLLSATATYGDLTDLPTAFVITSATNATWDGMVITVNDGLVIGQDTVTVTVSSVETDNYNAVSCAIVLEVGMADYSTAIAELEAAIAELKTLADSKADTGEIAEKLAEITNKINALEQSVATDAELTEAKRQLAETIFTLEAQLVEEVQKLQTQISSNDTDIADIQADIEEINGLIDALEAADVTLDGRITDAITKAAEELKAVEDTLKALINGVQSDLDSTKTKLDQAIADMNKAIEDGDNNLSAKIEALNSSLTEAQAALEKADADNKAELEGKIAAAQTALQTAIDKVAADLAQAKTELETAIANGDNALDEKITALNTALANAQAALEKADADNKAELEGKIAAAQTALQTAIDKVAADLAQAKTELETAIANGDNALDEKITALNTALANAQAALEAADTANKADLTLKIDEADAALQTAIDALASELSSVRQALEKADADNRTFIIVVCVISGLSFCGCGTIAVFYFIIDKKKKI